MINDEPLIDFCQLVINNMEKCTCSTINRQNPETMGGRFSYLTLEFDFVVVGVLD